jgi:hypothetical protein
LRAISDFYAAWNAAIDSAFLAEHADTLRQISKYFDVSVDTRRDLIAEVGNFTVYLRRLEKQFIDDSAQYKLLMNLVASGTVSRSLLAPLADKDLKLIERPFIDHLKGKCK